MKKVVVNHFLKVDNILYSVIDKLPPIDIIKSTDFFTDLVENIVSQQLSEKAGATIFGRFLKLFPNGKFTPEDILGVPDEFIRSTGPSWSKISYIKNIARAVQSDGLNLDTIDSKTDQEVIKELTKVKGIGPWTAEMFLMFTLGREDIFSYGDLGLKNAIKKLYGFKKDPTIKQMEKIVNKWKPYRTYAARILWKSLELKDSA